MKKKVQYKQNFLTDPVKTALIMRLTSYTKGQVAQSVEQRTENPRVRGSIPRLATILLSCLQQLNPMFIHLW